MKRKYLDSKFAAEIVKMMEQIPPYNYLTKSARCPLCGGWGDRLYKCTKHLKDRTHRYFCCQECGFKYKAVSKE